MLREAVAFLPALLLLSSSAFGQHIDRPTLQVRIDGPYAALLDVSATQYPHNELHSFRSEIQDQRDRDIDACKNQKSSLEEELQTAREKLKHLDKTTESRTGLHAVIAAAEHGLRNKQMECEAVIPAAFGIRLAKLRLIEDWPERRQEIVRLVESGHAEDRSYGDVHDIGYRKFFDGQEKDIALGEQAVRQMKLSGLMPAEINDAGTLAYVRQLADKIARSSDLKVPLHVSVLDSPEINAIALPGGFIFVTSGLVQAAAGEAELAGVLAHEIAHIAARHGARASKRSGFSNIFMQAAQVATGIFTGGVTAAGAVYGINYGFQGLGMLVNKALLGAKEKYLKEADQLAIQYLWSAGYDPRGLVAFLDSISRKEYSHTASFFESHPNLEQRLLNVFSEIQFLPTR
jgi:hypothetical protein